jgi:anti-sigma factor RsiW
MSVFIFPESSLRRLDENTFATKELSFSMETWSRGGLRYFAIGDASPADVDRLAKLFQAIGS